MITGLKTGPTRGARRAGGVATGPVWGVAGCRGGRESLEMQAGTHLERAGRAGREERRLQQGAFAIDHWAGKGP